MSSTNPVRKLEFKPSSLLRFSSLKLSTPNVFMFSASASSSSSTISSCCSLLLLPRSDARKEVGALSLPNALFPKAVLFPNPEVVLPFPNLEVVLPLPNVDDVVLSPPNGVVVLPLLSPNGAVVLPLLPPNGVVVLPLLPRPNGRNDDDVFVVEFVDEDDESPLKDGNAHDADVVLGSC